MARSLETYNKKGLAKTIDYSDYKMIDGVWTPSAILVLDVFVRSKTVLTYDKVNYNLPMKEDEFTVEALRRGE